MSPSLEYASSLWSPMASPTSINKLQVMQELAQDAPMTRIYNICMTKPTSFPYLKFIITVVAKRIWTYCYFIRKEQIKVKRANKSGKTVMFVTKIHVYTWYCSFLTLIIILQLLGMLDACHAGFYSRQTPDILPKMPLICCCKIGNDEVWYQVSYFSNMVPFYSVS